MSRRQSARKAQNEPVPQWVRDFIASREQQRLEEHRQQKSGMGEQADGNTYLLCPFDHDEVEAIRNGVRVLKEEAFLDDIQKNRKSRKAGQFVPYPGFSLNDNFSFERYFRQLLHTPLSRQQMQEAVVKHYGWGKWSEDPWGDSQRFYEWLNEISADDTRAVWALNETLGGRTFLSYGTVWALAQLDYSAMTEEDLFDYIGHGAENFLCLKRYTGWENFESHYLAEALPARLVNREIIKDYPSCSFSAYTSFVASIYLWLFAVGEVVRRCKGQPGREEFLKYVVASDSHLVDLSQQLAPEDYSPPDRSRTLMRMGEILNIKGIAGKYKDNLLGVGFSEEEKMKEAEITALEGLFKGMDNWVRKTKLTGTKLNDLVFPLSDDQMKQQLAVRREMAKNRERIVQAGVNGHLRNSLRKAVVNKLLDAIREVKKIEREVEDSPGEKKIVKVQAEIPASALLSQETEYTSDDLLERIAARQGLVETSFQDEFDARELLDSILQEAKLTKRQRMAIDLTLEGRKDAQITLELKKAFGKSVTEVNVRSLRSDAIRRLKEVVLTMKE